MLLTSRRKIMNTNAPIKIYWSILCVTLGIAELLPVFLVRKPFYDYNERWDTSTEVRE